MSIFYSIFFWIFTVAKVIKAMWSHCRSFVASDWNTNQINTLNFNYTYIYVM